MSYILDALRRADAERERDPARGIHAQSSPGVPLPPRRALAAWRWPAGALVIVVAATAVAWQWRAEPQPAPVAAAVRQPIPPAVPQPVAPAVLQPPAPLPSTAVLPPAPARAPVERMRAAPGPGRAAPAPMPAAAASTQAVVAAVAPATAPAASAASAAPTALATERVYNVAELPPDVQRELPKLTISGGVHSENVAQRMLIVGGQVMNEGSELAPGLVLEQIRSRTAVLRFRGWRYSVPF